MRYEKLAGKLNFVAVALIAVFLAASGLVTPRSAHAVWEYGWKQTDATGSPSGTQTRDCYMVLQAPNTTNMRIIGIGHKAGTAAGDGARFAIYFDTDAVPTGATKQADTGIITGMTLSAWNWISLPSKIDLPANQYFGVTYTANSAGTSYHFDNSASGNLGDCVQFYQPGSTTVHNKTNPMPATYETAGTPYNYTYSQHALYVRYPTVSTNPSSLNDSTAGYTITGAGFETMDQFNGTTYGSVYSGTTSEVWLTQNNNWAAPGTKVAQTITAWNDTSITFTSNFGALTPGTTAYLWVENSDGEHNASGIAVTLNSPSDPATYAGTATASVFSNTQINVSMPFVGDFDNDGDCDVEYNTSDSWPGTTATGSPFSGASPRSCSIPGLSAGGTYYVRVTYNDPDGVNGTATQVLGPYLMQLNTIAGSASAAADSSSQITVTVPFTGDVDGDGSTTVAYSTTGAFGGEEVTAPCSPLAGTSPRVCVITGLNASTNYWFRIDHTDPDGVSGTDPQDIGPYPTPGVPVNQPVVTLVTPGNWPTRVGQVSLKQKVAVVVRNPVTNTEGMTVSSVTLNHGSGTLVWGTVNNTAGTYGPVLPGVSNNIITWTGPFNIPRGEAMSFYCEMAVTTGVGTSADYTMTATAYTNTSGYPSTSATVPLRWSHRSYATGTYAYLGTQANPVYCVGEGTPLTGGVAYPFSLEFRVPTNSNTSNRYDWTGPTSTTQPSNPAQIIRVSIPAGWTNVTAPATQGIWNGVNVTGNSGSGWNIYGSIAPGSAMGPAGPSCGDFVTSLSFTATPPTGLSGNSAYTIQVDFGDTNHALSIEDYSSNCTITSTGTNRSALDLRGGFMALVAGGDIVPPANVTSFNTTASDNRVSLDWVNPTQDDTNGDGVGDAALTGFDGVLILRNTNTITNVPVDGQQYDENGVNGPASIGTSKVVYTGSGTSFVSGDPCTPALRLVNGTTYYYKAFPYDSKYNYALGSQVSDTPSDSTPPAAVSGVTATPGDRKNTIDWTNPSDCDFTGIRVRFSTSGFPTDKDGGDGSQLAGEKLGGTPGAPDSFLHSGLVNGTPYYYSIWTYDDDGNWDGYAYPASYSSPIDTEAPGEITDLEVVPGSPTAFTIALRWTAPADSGYDGTSGNASKYYLKYYNATINSGNWNVAWLPGGEWLPQPVAVGTQQSYVVTGLSPLYDYYFAIVAADEVGNMSPISSNATGTTLCNEDLSECDQCHQMPPTDGLPGQHPRATGNIGKHSLPIHAGAGEAEVCNVCHANGLVWRNNTTLYGFNHQNFIIDVNDPGKIGNLAERESGTGGTFVMYTTTVFKFDGYSTGIGYTQKTGYCDETYCHGAGLSSPRWGIDQIVCGEYCHETPPATGKHVKHYHPGQHYTNFAPAGVQVSGYTIEDGSAGWTGAVTMGTNGYDRTAGGNEDERYATYLEAANAQKTYLLPDGNWYITVCVGDSDLIMLKQTVEVSGDGGASWEPLIEDFDCRPEKHFDKTVDFPFTVTGGNNMILKIGNGVDATRINYMIVNSTPEAPKTNNTILQNTASAYGFNCGKCHTADNTQSGHTGHVNGAVLPDVRDAEIHFDANSFPKNPLGNYTALFDPYSSYMDGQGFNYTLGQQCVNTYCHGTTLSAGGTATNPTWSGGYVDVEGASLCGACHEAGYADTSPTTNMDTGSHEKHVSRSFAYRIDCAKCHYHTVGFKDASGIIPITDKTHHVNGDVDAVFDPNDNTMKFGRYSTALNTCYEVYCHSNGLLKNNQPFWATVYREPLWGDVDKECDYCHGTGTGDGHPAYTNTTATPNSHPQHREANGIGCTTCHFETTRDNGLSIYTTHQPTYHVNGESDVVFNPAVTPGEFNHSNLECTNTYCHGLSTAPTWGSQTVTCGVCHGDGIDKPNPGVGQHAVHNNGTYDANSTIVTNGSTSADYDFSCRFCHYRRTHGNGEYITGTQAAEVNFNTVAAVNGYNNSGAFYNTGEEIFVDPVTGWNYTNGNCSGLKCHSDGNGGPPNNTFFTWTSSVVGVGGCDGCHSATASDDFKMDTGSHGEHVWKAMYRRNCHDCHYATTYNTGNDVYIITDKSKHVNGSVDVAMSPAFGGTYNEPTHQCSSVFCHSNGDPAAWNGPESGWYVLINWTSTAGTNCLTCHSNNYYPAGDGVRTQGKQTLSFNHEVHLTDYSPRIGCTNCHHATAQDNTTIQPTVPSVHNNGKKNVVYYTTFFNHSGVTEGGTGYWGTWQDSPLDGFCTVICHSDGKAGNPVRFPNWSTPQGTYGCGSCHGAKGSLTTGSHEKHVTTLDLGCVNCHRLTAGGTAAAPFVNASGFANNHVDGEPDIALQKMDATWSDVTEKCSNTDAGCHGAGESPQWGTVATCYTCHIDTGSIGTELDDYTYGAGGKATINELEWLNAGHGRTTAYPYTGNSGANMADCTTNCHTYTVAHNTAANPFRLTNADTNAVCTACHLSSQADHHSEAIIDANQTGADATWTFTPKCVDCHDPHGDNGGVTTGSYNAAMLHSAVATTGSDTYGVPNSTTSVDFPLGFPGGSFVWDSYVNAGFGGVCQVCHDVADNVANFNKTTYNTGHNPGNACESCHGHDKGFAGAGCNSCHGNPPNTGDAKSDNVGAVGAHDLHATTLNIGCADCHGHNGSGGQHNVSGESAGYSGFLNTTNITVDVSGAPAYHGGTQTYNGAPGAWDPVKTCSDIGCHYGESKSWDCQ